MDFEPLISRLLVSSSTTVPQNLTILRNCTLCNITLNIILSFLSVESAQILFNFCSFLLYNSLCPTFSRFSCTQPLPDFLKTLHKKLCLPTSFLRPTVPSHVPPPTNTTMYPHPHSYPVLPHVPFPHSTPSYNPYTYHLPNLRPHKYRPYLPPSPHLPPPKEKSNSKRCKINANLNAKYVNLALNAFNLFKICPKFNAKYVRSTLISTQNYLRSTLSSTQNI